MAEGERYDAVYMIAGRGKRMVTGRSSKEKLGLIERGSLVQNLLEDDIIADAGVWVHADCGQPFTINSGNAWCNTCSPRAGGVRDIRQMRPRPAMDRINIKNPDQQAHPNFTGMQQDPWGDNKDVSARQQPNYAEPAQPLPPPPTVMTNQPVTPIPPPPIPGQKKARIPQVQQERAKKEQAMGIPVIAKDVPSPPMPLEPEPSRGVTSAGISTVVDARYTDLLRRNGVLTLYDASKKGVAGLESISGIGNKTAVKIIDAAEMELVRRGQDA